MYREDVFRQHRQWHHFMYHDNKLLDQKIVYVVPKPPQDVIPKRVTYEELYSKVRLMQEYRILAILTGGKMHYA